MKIGEVIQTLRKKRNLSQLELSSILEIDQSYLSQIENGRKEAGVKLLKRVSEHFEIPLPMLLLMSVSEEDVKPEKRELFRILFPRVKELIGDLF